MSIPNAVDPSKFSDDELKAALQYAEIELKEASNHKKRIVETILNRNSEKLESLLKQKDEPYGVVHIDDLEFSYGKKVSYDQAGLVNLFKLISASGEDAGEYIDVEYSVSEKKYKAWPTAIREQFEGLRTVVRGNPTVKITTKE